MQTPGGTLRKIESAASVPDRSAQRLMGFPSGPLQNRNIGKPVTRGGSGNIFTPKRDFRPSRRIQHPTTMNPT